MAAPSCKVHVVRRGDWLIDIGRQHKVDVESLKNANPELRISEVLQVGKELVIPVSAGGGSRKWSPLRGRAPVGLPSTSGGNAWGGRSPSPTRRQQPAGRGESTSAAAKPSPLAAAAVNRPRTSVVAASLRKKSLLPRRPKVHKAGAAERASVMEGTVVAATLQPVRAPQSQNPWFRPAGGDGLRKRRKGTWPAPRLKTVKVAFGDTLADIAYMHKLSIRELQRLNNLRDDSIFEGDVLAVSEGPLGRPPQELRPGLRRTHRPLFSRQHPGASKSSGGRLGIGGPEIVPQKVRKAGADGLKGVALEGRWKNRRKGFQPGIGGWMRFNSPVTDGFVSSPFGWRWGAFHEGVDLAADFGTPILASDRGMVTFAGWSGGYGYLVAIQHDGGLVTRYGHCCAIHARVGQHVSKGQQVAAVGATGHATGPHLHFEVRKNGEALDPFKWVNL
eukprot:SM000255S08776  [mRNA]  locus=s255:41697:45182:- [translate_table: standard]